MKNARKKNGKYLTAAPTKRRKGRVVPKALVGIIMILVIALAAMLWAIQSRSIYQTIVHDGYSGTQEQWLASLVGEEADANAESAYELAVKNGYKASEADWIKALVGASVDVPGASPYTLACENGFNGSLSEWLTSIADKPEKLGISKDGDQKSEYELACEYGYTGTFIEWLVSVAHDRVFE